MAEQGGLSERERAMLDFEGSWWKVATTKEQLIRERFHISPDTYHRKLVALIERETAFSYHPFVVQRLRREKGHRAPRVTSAEHVVRKEGHR